MSASQIAQRLAKSIGATALLLFVLFFFPYQFITRFSSGMANGFRGTDLALGLGVYAWVLAATALLQRDSAPTKSRLVPWGFHVFMTDLVEISFLGVGPWNKAVTLHNPAVGPAWLTSPVLDQALVGPGGFGPAAPVVVAQSADEDAADDLVVLRRRQKKASILAGVETTTYVVQRGDTWWSMAEKFISDGRKWKDLREINFGHEPVPGVTIDDRVNSTPLIGWSVLVPAEIIEAEESSDEPAISSGFLDVAREALT